MLCDRFSAIFFVRLTDSLVVRMSTINSVFFSKELTCLPSLLDKYVGRYYNNGLSNAITWGFFIWLVVHFIFDRFGNVSRAGYF